MNIKILNPLDVPDWDEQILSLPGYSFFHSSAWARVLIETYGYKPVYFSLLDGDRLRTVLPVMEVNCLLSGKRGVSLPFSDFCPPLLEEDDLLGELFGAMIEYGNKQHWNYLEMRGGQNVIPEASVFQTYQGHDLALMPETNKLIKGFRDSTWRNVEKAESNGITVKILNTMQAIKDFYRLHCYSRKRQGVPPQPFAFFKNIQKHILARGFGWVVLAYQAGQVVSGNIYFHFGKKAIYKYGATDVRYRHLRPANMVMWQGIKWYADHDYTRLSFGRTDLEDKGLSQFKKGWGTTMPVIRYYRYSLPRATFILDGHSFNRFYKPIFKKVPLDFLRVMGCFLYRHVG